MMSEDVITDLKQFITATVSQATTDLVTKSDLAASEERLLQHINNVQDAIAETLTSAIEDLHETSHNHEKRITTLERKLA